MTDNFKKETMKVQSSAVALVLMKFSHEDWADDLRLVGNTSEITSGGEVYLPYGITFTAPKEGDATITATVVIEDTFRAVTAQFEEILDSVSMNAFVILASNPEEKEKDYGNFSVVGFSVTGTTVTLTIARTTILRNSLSSYTIAPADFYGLFLA